MNTIIRPTINIDAILPESNRRHEQYSYRFLDLTHKILNIFHIYRIIIQFAIIANPKYYE